MIVSSIVLEAVSCHFLSFSPCVSLAEMVVKAAAVSGAAADKGENAAAALPSAVVAAHAPIRWLLSCPPPFIVAQNSQFSGCSRACRRSLRRQFLAVMSG